MKWKEMLKKNWFKQLKIQIFMYQQKSQIYSIYPNSQNFKMAQRQEDYMNKYGI